MEKRAIKASEIAKKAFPDYVTFRVRASQNKHRYEVPIMLVKEHKKVNKLSGWGQEPE